MTNAYYSPILFTDIDDPSGVMFFNDDTNTVCIRPLSGPSKTVELNGYDIVELVRLAITIFTDENIAEISEILDLEVSTDKKELSPDAQ